VGRLEHVLAARASWSCASGLGRVGVNGNARRTSRRLRA
jgi:hypothetical protein